MNKKVNSNDDNRFFSFTDTALRLIYFNIPLIGGDEYISSYQKVLKKFGNSKAFKEKAILNNIENIYRGDVEFQKLYIHEFHHYWQSFTYPFLYWLSYLELKTLLQASADIISTKEIIYVDDFRLNNKANSNLNYLSYTFKIAVNEELVITREFDDLQPGKGINRFCLNDLIETATAIFQFKVIYPIQDEKDFFLWVRDPTTKSYSKFFSYMSLYFDNDLLFDLLPICIQAAFHTTEPMGAFCFLVSNYKMFYDKNAKNNISLARVILTTKYPTKDMTPHKYSLVSEIPVSMITWDTYRELASPPISYFYPLQIHAMKYLDLIRKNCEETFSLEHKDFYFESLLVDANEKSHEILGKDFYPLGIIYRFLEIDGRDNVAVFSKEAMDFKVPFPGGSTIDTGQYFMETAKVKDITLSILSDNNKKVPRLCHHTNCSYYELDLCRRWTAIPFDYNECGFPTWFATLFQKRIDLENKLLVPLSASDLKNMELLDKENLQKAKNRGRFSFIEHDDLIILSVPKEILVTKQTSFFAEFIDVIASEKYKSLNLFGKIIIEFNDFNEDSREIFEIPLIRQWVKKLLEDYPFFPIFLNFSDLNYNQRLYILGCLVINERLPTEDDSVLLEFQKKSFMSFLEKSVEGIIWICNKLEIDFEPIVKQYLKEINE